MKPLDKNETGELIAAIHSLGKDKVREMALLMWQHIHELDAANSPEIPDGWKLVPIIAYPSQWAAGQKAHNNAGINKVDAVYKAMVLAAPDVIGFDSSLAGSEATVITKYYTPHGYRLVPTEMTRDMQEAWDNAPNCHEDDDVNMSNAYQAMLSAAPKPEK